MKELLAGASVMVLLFAPLVLAALLMNIAKYNYAEPLVGWHVVVTVITVAAAFIAGRLSND